MSQRAVYLDELRVRCRRAIGHLDQAVTEIRGGGAYPTGDLDVDQAVCWRADEIVRCMHDLGLLMDQCEQIAKGYRDVG